jgi:hypothetical protein
MFSLLIFFVYKFPTFAPPTPGIRLAHGGCRSPKGCAGHTLIREPTAAPADDLLHQARGHECLLWLFVGHYDVCCGRSPVVGVAAGVRIVCILFPR